MSQAIARAQPAARALAQFKPAGKKKSAQLALQTGERVHLDMTYDSSDGFIMVESLNGGGKGLVPSNAGVLALERGRAVMLGTFLSQGEGEMSAQEGEAVVLLQSQDVVPDGWELAAIGTRVGFVPASFMKELAEEPEPEPAAVPASFPSNPLLTPDNEADADHSGTIDADEARALQDKLSPYLASAAAAAAAAVSEASAAPPPEVLELIVMDALSSFEPEDDDAEMRMRANERFLLLQPPSDASSGWAEVQPLSDEDGSRAPGFVPFAFLQRAPADGAVISDFRGETAGEVSGARAGEAVWRIGPADASSNGWCMVLLASGVRGYVPEAYIEWGMQPTQQDTQPAAVEPPPASPHREQQARVSFVDDEPLTLAQAQLGYQPEAPLSSADEGDDSPSPASPESSDVEQQQDEWIRDARRLISQAGSAPRKAAVALADFAAETPVDLAVEQGEKLWVCAGAEAPETWVIAERKAGAGDEAYRGLVPETFVSVVEEEAEVTAAPEATQQQQQVQQAASQDTVEADVSAEQDEWIRDARRLISQAGSAPPSS